MVVALIIALIIMRRVGKESPKKWITISMLAMVTGSILMPFMTFIGLLFLISGFSVLEATLPVFIVESQTGAPRGSLMGGYFSCVQMGVFIATLISGYVRAFIVLNAVFVTADSSDIKFDVSTVSNTAYLYPPSSTNSAS